MVTVKVGKLYHPPLSESIIIYLSLEQQRKQGGVKAPGKVLTKSIMLRLVAHGMDGWMARGGKRMA